MSNGKLGSTELSVKEIVAISGWLAANAGAMRVSTREQRIEAMKAAINVSCTLSQMARVEHELGFRDWVKPASVEASPRATSRMDRLTRAVRDLYTSLGQKVPDYLENDLA